MQLISVLVGSVRFVLVCFWFGLAPSVCFLVIILFGSVRFILSYSVRFQFSLFLIRSVLFVFGPVLFGFYV